MLSFVLIVCVTIALVVIALGWGRNRWNYGLVFLLLAGVVLVQFAHDDERDTSHLEPQTPVYFEPENQTHFPKTPHGYDLVAMKKLAENRPIEVVSHGYVGSDACMECHHENHATWESSYHRTMTQVASPESILGDFDDVQINYQGNQYFLSKVGDTFIVDMPDELDRSKRVVAPIVMTTGSHHMQVYWFAIGTGRTTGMLPLVYLNETQEWIPRDSAFLDSVHEDPSFERGRWNEGCSICHSTQRKPRPRKAGHWDTHVGEFGISCEACHGPGEDHISLRRESKVNSMTAQPDTIVNPARLSKVRSSQVCGQCHASLSPLELDHEHLENGRSYRPGDDLTKSLLVVKRDSTAQYEMVAKRQGYPDVDTLLNEIYYPDGMVRVSGREYNGMTESSCYINGEMTCLSCHQMHKSDADERPLKEWANDQLKPTAIGDTACLQCHEADQYAATEHTHHEVGSSGATCYNCHMPHTAFGLLKAMRNHQISSPDIGVDQGAGRPNACNLCHMDKTLQWSAQHLQQWYEIEPPKLDVDQQEVAASLIWLLRGNAAERALSAWAMGQQHTQQVSGTDWQVPFLVALLDDQYDAIRLIARRSLRTFPGMNAFKLDVVTSTSSEQRKQAAFTVFDQWLDETSTTRVDRTELLIDKDSGFQMDRLRRLLEQRDNTPMLLSE